MLLQNGARGQSGRSSLTAIILGASTGLLVFSLLVLVGAWWRRHRAEGEAPTVLPSVPPQEVVVWVGELSPKVVALLATEWNDEGTDLRYDESMNAALDLPEGDRLALYRLQVFNTGTEPASVSLPDGAITIEPREGPRLPSKSLARVFARLSEKGRSSPQAATLKALGAGRETLDLPPESGTSHPIAFGRRAPLSEVVSVARADGTPFRQRRMPRKQWMALVEAPSLTSLEGL